MGPRSSSSAKLTIAALFVAAYAALHLVGLGHYALWDDEANTALFAQSVWRTGDTSAVVGDNVVAYGGGWELEGLVNRRISPLQYYVAAPGVGLVGGTLGARLPFALAGILLGVLVQVWLWRSGASLSRWILVDLGFLGNVSLVLYARQSRYYALVALLSFLVVLFYARYERRRGGIVPLALTAVALLAGHPLAYLSLGTALGLDHLLFGRSRRAIAPRDLALFVVLQVAIGAPLLWTWNPLGAAAPRAVGDGRWFDSLVLWWWNLRDLDACEFGSLAAVAAVPLLFLLRGRPRDIAVRLALGLVVAAGVTAFGSPQPVLPGAVADVRYLAWLIPGCILLAVRVLEAVPFPGAALRIGAAVLLFTTNTVPFATASLRNGDHPERWRSTLLAFVLELRSPPETAHGAAARWLERHARAGETVSVFPDFEIYPLMFHVPQLVYVGQFPATKKKAYPELAAHHFRGAEPPDRIVAFGRAVRDAWMFQIALELLYGTRYEKAGVVTHVHGEHRHRPELFWRSFTPTPVRDPARDGIYFFRRVDE